MHVLLFDIDGTLIRSGGAGKASMEKALRSEFGVAEIRDTVPYSGRTDLSISRDLLKVHNIEPSDSNVGRLRAAYLGHLPRSLQENTGIVLPGIRELLSKLQSTSTVVIGLLTGNVREGARCKLLHYDLWHYFPFGSFADGHMDRDDIARAAVNEVSSHLKSNVHPNRIWVIGDTPLDVQCARAIGARSVAVATGWHSIQELTDAKADWVLPDLREPSPLLEMWEIDC